ncbi:hypothetical protein M0R45_030810 [Rubus argutus]|uniref:Uncharacterized protein n=1 Tax=Rubus argutus TaxID=59490 RepID=A0AAW1WC90_RUBAR
MASLTLLILCLCQYLQNNPPNPQSTTSSLSHREQPANQLTRALPLLHSISQNHHGSTTSPISQEHPLPKILAPFLFTKPGRALNHYPQSTKSDSPNLLNLPNHPSNRPKPANHQNQPIS